MQGLKEAGFIEGQNEIAGEAADVHNTHRDRAPFWGTFARSIGSTGWVNRVAAGSSVKSV
jgi:hypothetical protein